MHGSSPPTRRASAGTAALVPPAALPERIWVIGSPGAGKTTVAARLAGALGAVPTDLDELSWEPGWVAAAEDVFAARVAAVAAQPRWVMAGNYSAQRDRFADLVGLWVWLDLPLYQTFARLVVRGVRRSLWREPCCNGNHETLWRTFCNRESLLLWALSTDRRRRTHYAQWLEGRPHVHLRSQTAIDQWLRRVAPAAPGMRLARVQGSGHAQRSQTPPTRTA